jgi:hypothetical protein
MGRKELLQTLIEADSASKRMMEGSKWCYHITFHLTGKFIYEDQIVKIMIVYTQVSPITVTFFTCHGHQSVVNPCFTPPNCS